METLPGVMVRVALQRPIFRTVAHVLRTPPDDENGVNVVDLASDQKTVVSVELIGGLRGSPARRSAKFPNRTGLMKTDRGRHESSVRSSPAPAEDALAKAPLRDHLLFMRKFFRQGRRIASIWPSSRAMAVASLHRVRWEKARVIVELGPGTGAITQEIVRRLKPPTRLIAVERDVDFMRILRARFGRCAGVTMAHGDVKNLAAILRREGIAHHGVDYFISGLGTPSLPRPTRQALLDTVGYYLQPHGCFTNITEIPWYYWPYYRRHFRHVAFQLVPLNLPPGGVYHCQSPRGQPTGA